MDARRTPVNDFVAADYLRATVTAPKYSKGQLSTIKDPIVDLLASPSGARDRQLLFGAHVMVYDKRAGYAFVQAQDDQYVGYVPIESLGPVQPITHQVTNLSTTTYIEPSFKARDLTWLPLGARVQITGTSGRFCNTQQGWIPQEHLTDIGTPPSDPIAVAMMFLNAPYLWGGNSTLGIDCSGLVQVASRLCGLACPADSDQQFEEFGTLLPKGSTVQAGDLLFWKGHVAWVKDADTLLHANAYHMKTALEPITSAIDRIENQGDGPVIGHKRLVL